MQIINRKMTSSQINTEAYFECQASINSDGCITFRKYNREEKDKDVIVVLTQKETNALIALFKGIKDKFKIDDLPF